MNPPPKILMGIEQFIAQSEGEWRSMRTSHSVAFQQFENIVSFVNIKLLSINHPDVVNTLISNKESKTLVGSPFRIDWNTDSDWSPDQTTGATTGSSILIPIPESKESGRMLRSLGYAEEIQAVSSYRILDDGTFTLTTNYEKAIADERIWFISENVRCRSSVVRTSKGSGIIQTSFASELRILSSK